MSVLLGMLKTWWPQIVASLALVAFGAWAAWQIQGVRIGHIETAFSKYQNEVKQNELDAKRVALDKEKFWLGEIENARINAQSREARLKKDVAVAQSAVGGLRNDLRAMQARLATSPNETCLSTAIAIGDLLSQCGEDYQSMAEIADRHASDVKTLIEAWPK